MTDANALPDGVVSVRRGPGANCSSAGSAIDVLFYGSVAVAALAIALAAAFTPRKDDDGDPETPSTPREIGPDTR